MRRESCVHFQNICIDPISALITNGRAARERSFWKVPPSAGVFDINASGKALPSGIIENFAFNQRLLAFAFALIDDGGWILRRLLRIDITGQVAKSDHFEIIGAQVVHEFLETLRLGMHPRMVAVRDPM